MINPLYKREKGDPERTEMSLVTQLRGWTLISCISRSRLYHCTIWEALSSNRSGLPTGLSDFQICALPTCSWRLRAKLSTPRISPTWCHTGQASREGAPHHHVERNPPQGEPSSNPAGASLPPWTDCLEHLQPASLDWLPGAPLFCLPGILSQMHPWGNHEDKATIQSLTLYSNYFKGTRSPLYLYKLFATLDSFLQNANILWIRLLINSFLGGAVVRNLPVIQEIQMTRVWPESERSPGGGNRNPLQYSCLDNPMNRGAWWATVHQVTKSQTRLSTHACTATSGKRTGLETSFLSVSTFDPSLAKTG